MKVLICSVFDKKAGEFQAPFAQPNKAVACRSFMQFANSDDSIIKKFPADYALYQIGTMDVKTGKLEQVTEMLLEAENVVNK